MIAMGKRNQYLLAPGFEMLEGWVKELPTYFEGHGISIFKDRNEVKVFNILGFELNVKAFKLPNLINRYAYVYVRGSKAARSFLNASRFLAYGASTPTPVAYVECISGGKLRESYYVSLHYRCDFTLRDVLNNQVPDKQNILLKWVHFTWSQLHRNGIFHLDYSPGNTLIKKMDNTYEFAVVDLNRMKFKAVGFEDGIRNFRQLDTDVETLKLIAKEYASLCGKPADQAINLLLKLDQRNKNYRHRKGNFKGWLRGEEG